MEIIDFRPDFAAAFERLNLEWLEKYFYVEEIDRIVLSNPAGKIIAGGGQILFARLDEELVGTVALKHEGEGRFELTKMAVTASQQGRGIGRALMVAAIDRFHAIEGKFLFLETSSTLQTAINLYESAGFRHETHPGGSDYERSDTYMVYCPD
ncbi:MAG: GNAT family N-acetyltransferase [Woeseiaceae bacterium]